MAVGLQGQAFNFIGGKNTEASPFTQPPNTAKELTNVALDQFGRISRRRGLDLESGWEPVTNFGILPSTALSLAINTYKWRGTGENLFSTYEVIQIGSTLFFFDSNSSVLSANYVGVLDLSTYATGAVTEPFEMTTGLGKLFVSGTNLSPLYVEYANAAFTATTIEYKVRDFTGVDDTYAIDYRPVEATDGLTAAHEYNLRNQGWPGISPISSDENKNTLAHFENVLHVYPSNSDIYFQFKSATDYFYPKAPITITSGASSKGRFIIDPFALDRESASGISNLTASFKDTVPTSKPAAGAFWYGRYVSSGLRDEGHTGKVFISKLLETASDAGICYQMQDPTTENINALLATDGLVLTIAEMGVVSKVVPLGTSLLFFATNGVWELVGGADTGFTAETYSINKITDVGTTYKKSIVVAEAVALYWAHDGIYVISPDKSTGKLSSVCVSRDKIQTDYLAIPGDSRSLATGFFDRADSIVYWQYHTDGNNIAEGRALYASNAILLFNLRIGAFYDYEIAELATASPFMLGMCKTEDTAYTSTSEVVYDSLGDEVLDSLGADVTAVVSYLVTNPSTLKVLVYIPSGNKFGAGFAEFSDRTFVDWKTANGTGVDAPVSILTGHDVSAGQEGAVTGARRRSSQYIITHFNQTETAFATSGGVVGFDYPSSCKLRARWDFAGTSTFGKWSDQWEVYRLTRPFIAGASGEAFDYGREVITTKNKIRGSGKAVQLHFTSTAGKDMQLLGWESMNAMSGKV